MENVSFESLNTKSKISEQLEIFKNLYFLNQCFLHFFNYAYCMISLNLITWFSCKFSRIQKRFEKIKKIVEYFNKIPEIFS